MRTIIKIIFLILIVFFLALALYFFTGEAPERESMTWGVDFSHMQAESLGLDWKENYIAILDDLGVKNIKLHTQWNFVEGKKDNFYFQDIDWQIKKAEEHGAKVIYVVGMKTGRWPECHLPEWAKDLPKSEQQKELLAYIQQVVLRYKNHESITYWQVENEPLFRFGECPWYDKNFLKKEVELVKSLDRARQVIVSDSGELSLWINAANIGDILGVTVYRKVRTHIADGYGFYWTSVFSPASYQRKARIVNTLFSKKVIGVELQTEPWTVQSFTKSSLKEQEKTMNLRQFRENIDFARKTGLDEFYLWGAEWWYWLKEKHNKPEIWNEARSLFQNSFN